MKQTYFSVLAALLAASPISLAQGPRGPRNPGGMSQLHTTLNMANIQTVTGTVTAVNLAYGAQYPTITVAKSVIKVAPVWFLLDRNFELKAGDPVSLTAAPSLLPNDSYLYAIDILNTASKAKVVLRDTSGIPLWTGLANGRGNPGAPGDGIGCIDPGTVATVYGTVEKVSMGAGIQMPTLVVKTNDGKLIAMKLGPERILLAADFELKEGEDVSAKYASGTCMDENVALQLTDATGKTVVLREEHGTPNWN